ncbi:MAG: hypothetical protein EOP84_13885 [Verrucomicrobiaceae bacterium]|nr:MAG: hypothetical protein EOP84_13885 [Verrucomicrobiaceae bacterium]
MTYIEKWEKRTIDFTANPSASDMAESISKLSEQGWHLVQFSGSVATLRRPTLHSDPQRVERQPEVEAA